MSEPLSGTRWPAVHWSRVLQAGVGDPRTTWELNRFGWVWDWILAFSREPEGPWAAAFGRQLAAWEEQNPFRLGINWVSGQELAIRALAWTAGAAVFADTEGFGEADFRRFGKLAYWHAYQLDDQLDFARLVVPNNHLLAESLMLAILADLIGSQGEGTRWRERGLSVFRDAVEAQFREDGGYCQNSHRYHGFALELVWLADRWFEELRDVTEPVMEQGLHYLRTMLVGPAEVTGRVWNFGPNDGAVAFRLAGCDASDVRPLLALLSARLGAPFPSGPWDEQVAWLGASGERAEGMVPNVEPSRSFPASGLHVLRHGPWSTFFRCGASSVRGGHADQLHLDAWRDGEPVVIDAGSARYFDEAHRWHVGTAAHNTVTVDGRDQQELLARFTWLEDAPSHLSEFDPTAGRVVGSTEAYLDLGVLHEREVVVGDAVVVKDTLTPVDAIRRPHAFRLHWLLPLDVSEAVLEPLEDHADCFTWNISTPDATFVIEVQPVVPERFAATLEIRAAAHAPAYGACEVATSIVVEARGYSAKFVTTIRAPA